MAWFDKLKDIVKIDLRGAKLIELNFHISNKKNSDNKIEYHEANKQLTFHYPLLEPEEQKILQSALKSGFEDSELDIFEKKSRERLLDIKEKSKGYGYTRILPR